MGLLIRIGHERLKTRCHRLQNASRGARAGLIVATIGLSLGLWFLRRPDQLLHPYVWVEEYQLLNTFQVHGLFHVVSLRLQGYFVWPTSFTVSLAAATSFANVPVIDYWLSTGWFIATLCLILIPASRIHLLFRVGMALLLVLAPMRPEIYGIAEYSFWWTSLWPLISLIWAKDYWWLRIPILIIGGMSSLAGSALALPYLILLATTHKRRYLFGASILGATLTVQTIGYFTSPRSGQIHFKLVPVILQELRNFADYLFTWVQPYAFEKPPDSSLFDLIGACILLVTLGSIGYLIATKQTTYVNELTALVSGLLILSILSSIPAPLISDPIVAGPRYYFFTFVVLSWIFLLIIATTTFPLARIGAACIIMLSLIALPQTFAKHDQQVSWSQELSRCSTTRGPFVVPVQYDGIRSHMWQNLLIWPDTCRKLGYR